MNPSTPSGRAIRVLLVEGSTGDAHVLRDELGRGAGSKFQVIHARRLDAARSLLASDEFDVVLLDLDLPDSQGFETFSSAHRASGGTPIVVLSGKADEPYGVRAVQQGARDHLIKGEIPPGRLERTLRRARQDSAGEDWAGTFVASADGRLRTCNAHFARMFGFEGVDAALSRDAIAYLGDAAAAIALREKIRNEGRLVNHALVLRRADGRGMRVLANLAGGFASDGTLIEIRGILVGDSRGPAPAPPHGSADL